MDSEKIKLKIEDAIIKFYERDRTLIDDKVHEQAIAAKIMSYLQQSLPDWDVDVEFNRQGIKRGPKEDAEGNKRKPDIIIHRRGPDGPNLAVILIKCEWNHEPRENDQAAAKSIKQKHGYEAAYILEILKNRHQLSKV